MQSPEHAIYRIIYLFDPAPEEGTLPYLGAAYIEATSPNQAESHLKLERPCATPILTEKVESEPEEPCAA